MPPMTIDNNMNKGAGKIPIVMLYVAFRSAGVTIRAIAWRKLKTPNNCPD